MNRWGRIVLALATVATATWIVSGAAGFRVADAASLARHTLLAFAALLALTLCHLWVGVYLVVVERLLLAARVAAGESARALARARRIGIAGAALAVVAALAQFTSANALYPSRLDADWHALAGLGSALALATALALEWSALRAAGRVAAGGSA